MRHSETIGEITSAMVKAQQNMANAKKGVNNPFFKSKYADFNEVRATVLPALNENGIAVFQTPGEQDGRIIVETVLAHESGEWIAGTVSLKASKDDPQGAGSAITYGRRYGLSALCSLGAEDDDAEGATDRNKPESINIDNLKKALNAKLSIKDVEQLYTSSRARIEADAKKDEIIQLFAARKESINKEFTAPNPSIDTVSLNNRLVAAKTQDEVTAIAEELIPEGDAPNKDHALDMVSARLEELREG